MIKSSHFVIAIIVTLAIQLSVGYWLFEWTMEDFRPTTLFRMQMNPAKELRRIEELQKRPWRPWARLSLSSILGVGTLVLDGYLLLRLGPLVEER